MGRCHPQLLYHEEAEILNSDEQRPSGGSLDDRCSLLDRITASGCFYGRAAAGRTLAAGAGAGTDIGIVALLGRPLKGIIGGVRGQRPDAGEPPAIATEGAHVASSKCAASLICDECLQPFA